MASITAANSVFALSIAGLIPAPVQLQGYATDDAFDTEGIETAEVMIGVDGKKSAGFIFALVKQTIMLQADSVSNDIFETWHEQQQQQKELFDAQGTIVLPSTGMVYTLSNGTLTSHSLLPNVKKILQPRQYQITWERITRAKQ